MPRNYIVPLPPSEGSHPQATNTIQHTTWEKKAPSDYRPCTTLNLSSLLNKKDFLTFFNAMLEGLQIYFEAIGGKVFIKATMTEDYIPPIIKISELLLSIFRKKNAHYKEICEFGPTFKKYMQELSSECCNAWPNQLDGYFYVLKHFIASKNTVIGVPTNQFLYQNHGFPMSETIGCFFIDFDLWPMIKPYCLNTFRQARDLFFDRDVSAPQYSNLYAAIGYSVDVEDGYFSKINDAFSHMCSMAKYECLPQLKDIIHWHDIATKNLSLSGLKPERSPKTNIFPLSSNNSTPEGITELLELNIITKSASIACDTSYGCRKGYLYQETNSRELSIVGSNIFDSNKLHVVINQSLKKLESMFLSSHNISSEMKIKNLIRLIKFIQVSHFFYDGNTRTCLVLFYYFIIRFKQPLTILSDPNIFEGFTVNEIYTDIVKGHTRYKLLCQGKLSELKRFNQISIHSI